MKLTQKMLELNDINHEVIREDSLLVRTEYEGGKLSIFIKFFDNNSMRLVGIGFPLIPSDKSATIYKTINGYNALLGHVKFYLVESFGHLNIRIDDIFEIDTCGDECLKLIDIMIDAANRIYPVVVRIISEEIAYDA